MQARTTESSPWTHARRPAVYMCAMIPYVLGSGKYRSAVVDAQVVKHALRAGMKEGETTAAQANCKALGMMVMPQVYSFLFTRYRETMPGAPYIVCILITMVGQALVWTVGDDAMGDSAPSVRE